MENEQKSAASNATWFVGASYGGTDDQMPRFLSEGIWENGYEDKYLDVVRSMRPGDRIAIKAAYPASGRRIVIDTKFTSIVKSGWYREETLRSAYVYQIYAYLRSQVGRGDLLADSASGLLLHPAVGQMVDETVVIQGQSIRFATVDLAASPAEIRSRLLSLC